MIRRTRAVLVHENAFVRVFDDEVLFEDGVPGTHLRIEPVTGPGVVAVPVCEGDVALVRTWRYAVDGWQWALPRGFGHGSSTEQSVLAELAEEIGGAPEHLTLLGRLHSDSGTSAVAADVYLATYATRVASPSDAREVDAVAWVPMSGLWGRVASGEITDGFTLAALALLHART